MAGRCKPYKSLDVTKEQFLKLLEENNGNLYATYTALKLPYNRFAQWREEDKEFAEAIERIKTKTKEWVESKMFSFIAGTSGDSQSQARMVQFYLKTQCGYTETKRVEADLSTSGNIDVDATIKSIKEELESE